MEYMQKFDRFLAGRRLVLLVGLSCLMFSLLVVSCKDASDDSTKTKYRQVQTLAGAPTAGLQDGAGKEARFFGPTALIPSDQGFYVLDTQNNAVRFVSADASHQVTTQVRAGLNLAYGGVIFQDYLYIADSAHNQIKRFNLKTPAGLEGYTGVGAEGFIDGPLGSARFNFPMGLSLSGDGKILVADSKNDAIRAIDVTAGTVSTFLDGKTAVYAKGEEKYPLKGPRALAVDGKGNLFISDFNNNVIRYYDGGKVSVYAGSLTQPGGADGQGTAARFFGPFGIFLDAKGNLWVADSNNNKIRLIATDQKVTTYAGSGVLGSADGPSNQAQFNMPTGLALDKNGNLWVADQGNNSIRWVSSYLQ